MNSFLITEAEIVFVLLVVSVVAIAVRYVKLPYTVALVLAGLVLAVRGDSAMALTPELVLGLFLPPLVFEAAFHLQLHDLRAGLRPILVMAAPGVAVSTAVVGGVLALTGVLPLPVAVLFGALISATDPIAVIATFRAMGAPKRLSTVIEGESLLNDGTAIVIFHIVLAWALGGSLSPAQGVIDFVLVSVGGLFVGLVLGYAVDWVIAHIDDYLIEITLTTILAYGSYLLAEQFHVSGVLAVVAAGFGQREHGRTRDVAHHAHCADQLLGIHGLSGELFCFYPDRHECASSGNAPIPVAGPDRGGSRTGGACRVRLWVGYAGAPFPCRSAAALSACDDVGRSARGSQFGLGAQFAA